MKPDVCLRIGYGTLKFPHVCIGKPYFAIFYDHALHEGRGHVYTIVTTITLFAKKLLASITVLRLHCCFLDNFFFCLVCGAHLLHITQVP